MGYIYLITNKIDGKKYVGQTLIYDIHKRWKQHFQNNSNCIYLKNALNKYGKDNFKFQIICICFDDNCNDYEISYIKKYNTLAPNGYNLREGGKNGKQHPDSNEKRRIAATGKKYSQETIEKSKNNRIPLTGINNHNFGKKMSDEQKSKISNTMKEKNKTKIFKLNDKQYAGLKTASIKLKKKVAQYSLKNELIAIFDSLTEAARSTNNLHQSISKCCTGAYKQSKGFIWKHVV
jgi:group I intron endonuclease